MSKKSIFLIIVLATNLFAFQQSWYKQYQFPTLYEIDSICFIDSTTGWAAGWEHAGPAGVILKTQDGGLNWQEQFVDSTYGKFNDISFQDSLNGWAAGMFCLYKTMNGGKNWIRIADSLFNFEVDVGLRDMQSVSFSDSMTGIVVGTESSIAITHDGGLLWDCSTVIPQNGFIDTLFHGIMLSNQRACVCGHGGIAISSDSGNTWQVKYLENQYYKKCFFIDNKYGWVISNWGQILYSNNSGATWTDNGYIFQDYYTKAIDIAFIDTLYGYVITNTGAIWFTQDGGHNWESSEISKNVPLASISATPSKKSYVLNKNNSLYKNKIKLVGIESNKFKKAEILTLSNNYPNPFNSETTINYRINYNSNVKIDIYNINGKYICTLIDEFKNKGSYSISWNSNKYYQLASGLYYYTIITNKNKQTKKMLLIK